MATDTDPWAKMVRRVEQLEEENRQLRERTGAFLGPVSPGKDQFPQLVKLKDAVKKYLDLRNPNGYDTLESEDQLDEVKEVVEEAEEWLISQLFPATRE